MGGKVNKRRDFQQVPCIKLLFVLFKHILGLVYFGGQVRRSAPIRMIQKHNPPMGLLDLDLWSSFFDSEDLSGFSTVHFWFETTTEKGRRWGAEAGAKGCFVGSNGGAADECSSSWDDMLGEDMTPKQSSNTIRSITYLHQFQLGSLWPYCLNCLCKSWDRKIECRNLSNLWEVKLSKYDQKTQSWTDGF